MRPVRVGIVAESTGLGIREAVARSAKIAAEGIEFNAAGPLAPAALGETGRRELRNLLRTNTQDLAAIHVPLRRGIDSAENLQPRLEHIRKVMQMAFDLGTRRIVVACPPIPDDLTTTRAQTMRESLLDLGAFGNRIGTVLALEIGLDSSEKVRDYLDRFDTGGLKVAYDPANMLVHGHDPLAGLLPLRGRLAHVHARDARAVSVSQGVQEVPLGAGDVDWMAFTATLQVLEFHGFLCVKRDQGNDRLRDTAAGVKFLRRFLAPVV